MAPHTVVVGVGVGVDVGVGVGVGVRERERKRRGLSSSICRGNTGLVFICADANWKTWDAEFSNRIVAKNI